MQDQFPNYYKIICDNIRYLRAEHELSQEKFAEKVGRSREFISRLENYHEQPSLQLLLDMAKAFGILPQFFFENR